jgi:hypothetical protein
MKENIFLELIKVDLVVPDSFETIICLYGGTACES